MTPNETAAILRQFNEWSLGDEDLPQFDPREIGEAIDAAVEMIDRLEAAEKELVEIRHGAAVANDTIKALRAKIEAMERQKPVAKVESWTNGSYTRHYKLEWLRDVGEGAALYVFPGAQPAPSVPDRWNLVPIEPTTEMICEMERQWMCGSQIDMAKREWKAACAAAPEAKP